MKTILGNIGKHLADWAELYLWVPVSLLSIFALAELYSVATGRTVQDDPAWVVEMAPLLVRCVFAIALVSIYKQATSVWYAKEELLGRWQIMAVDAVTRLLVLCAFLYSLSH